MFFEGTRKTFIIFFTARSGSSWLMDLCRSTGRLGRPGEIFNFAVKPHLKAMPLDSAVAMMVERNTHGGVFGAEVTWGHLQDTFGGPEGLFEAFNHEARMIILYREDIVAQAVSAMRRVQTKVGHAFQKDPSLRESGGKDFHYDEEFLRNTVRHRFRNEMKFERVFTSYDIEPLRISYERSMANPLGAVNAIARHIEEPLFTAMPTSDRIMLRGSRSHAFAERFRNENAEYVQGFQDRRTWLKMLATYDDVAA
ncbi:MAG: hypothetical protein AcusKO_37970 [Acuticoccus sp.]